MRIPIRFATLAFLLTLTSNVHSQDKKLWERSGHSTAIDFLAPIEGGSLIVSHSSERFVISDPITEECKGVWANPRGSILELTAFGRFEVNPSLLNYCANAATGEVALLYDLRWSDSRDWHNTVNWTTRSHISIWNYRSNTFDSIQSPFPATRILFDSKSDGLFANTTNGVYRWDGRSLWKALFPQGFRLIAQSPTMMIVAANDYLVYLFDRVSETYLDSLVIFQPDQYSAALSHDGTKSYIVTRGGTGIEYNLQTKSQRRLVFEDSLTSLSYDELGQSLLVTTKARSLQMWTLSTDEPVIRWRIDTLDVRYAAFTSPSYGIAGYQNGKLKPFTGDSLSQEQSRRYAGFGFVRLRDGGNIVTAQSGIIREWGPDGRRVSGFDVAPGSPSLLSPKGRYFATIRSSFASDTLFVWETKTGDLLLMKPVFEISGAKLCFSGDESKLALSNGSDSTIIAFDLLSAQSKVVRVRSSNRFIAFVPGSQALGVLHVSDSSFTILDIALNSSKVIKDSIFARGSISATFLDSRLLLLDVSEKLVSVDLSNGEVQEIVRLPYAISALLAVDSQNMLCLVQGGGKIYLVDIEARTFEGLDWPLDYLYPQSVLFAEATNSFIASNRGLLLFRLDSRSYKRIPSLNLIGSLAIDSQGFLLSSGESLIKWDKSLLSVKSAERASMHTRLFPNPATESVRIESDQPFSDAEMYDAVGRKVAVSVKDNEVDVRGLTPGAYFISIRHKNSTRETLPVIVR
jgi:hypothetical protein